MEQIKPNQYIKLQKKICNANVIITLHKMAAEYGTTPVDVCYRIIFDTVMKEYHKRLNEDKK